MMTMRKFIDERIKSGRKINSIVAEIKKSSFDIMIKSMVKSDISYNAVISFLYHDKTEEDLRCKISGKMPAFLYILEGHRKFCGTAKVCSCNKEAIKDRHAGKNQEQINKITEKRKETNRRKYGVDFASMTQKTKDKTEQTCLDRYCAKAPTLNLEVLDKVMATNTERLGVDWPQQNKRVKALTVSNNLKKFGGPAPACDDKILDKMIITYRQRYGADNPQKNKEVREKTETTNYKKYNGPAPLCDHDIVKKMQKTNFARYNGLSPMNDPAISERCVETRRKSYLKNLKEKCSDITFLFEDQEFVKANRHHEFQCNSCDHYFYTRLGDGRYPECPKCLKKTGRSKPERELFKLLSDNGVVFQQNTKSIIPPLELDFYIPNNNLAIEFNGLFWHHEGAGKDSNYHLNKTIECEKNGIELFHVFENDWINYKPIVESRILNKLGLNRNKIFARKCEIQNINTREAKEFLERTHVSGYANATVKIGLFYDMKLVSVMTFGKPRFNKHYEWELIRFASELNTTVVGGASRIMKYFETHYKPKNIITYADRRYSQGNLYRNLGFKELLTSKPNYWYFQERDISQVFSRVKFQKHKLEKLLPVYDSNLTEWENMQANDWCRIWDCGNYVFEKQY